MNKKNRKDPSIQRNLISCLMAVLLLFSMNGCSLAVNEGDGSQSRDYLIGASITRTEIEKIEGKVSWNEGEIEDLNFPGLDGTYFIYTTRKMEDGTIVYSTAGTEGIDRDAKFGTADEKGSIELTINSYVVPKEQEEYCCIYMNPIYMTKEKEVYTVGGLKLSVNTEDAANGASTGRSFKETERLKWIDSEVEVFVSVTANLYAADQPVKILFSEMDENHRVLKKTEYEPGKVPKVMNVGDKTAYILIESKLAGSLKQNEKNLEICSWDGVTTYQEEEDKNVQKQKATLFDTFYALPNGLLLKNSTWVIWPE